MNPPRRRYKLVVQYENQEGKIVEVEGKPTTHKKASREAVRLIRAGRKAKVVEHVSCQGLLPNQ